MERTTNSVAVNEEKTLISGFSVYGTFTETEYKGMPFVAKHSALNGNYKWNGALGDPVVLEVSFS
jgi:hypothetical protein